MSVASPILAFKAGRCFRVGETNRIEPSPVKGAIFLTQDESGLLHFIWKNRTTNEIEEDLILFVGDATFAKVEQCTTGRVYALQFSSSDQSHFFWLQDASTARDEEFITNVRALFEDPEYVPRWNTAPAAAATASSSSQPQASTSQAPTNAAAASTNQATPDQLAQLQELVAQMAGNTGTTESAGNYYPSLSDILTPANLTPLFNTHPELIPALFPHLPPDLPTPPSPEVLLSIINSPQFRSALSSFDYALRTGLLGSLVRGLGLPEEAGTGVGPFLRAVQEQADRERAASSEDSMQTD